MIPRALGQNRPTAQTFRRRGGTWRALLFVVALVMLAVTAGCSLRIETPAPTAPAPDAAEVLREAMVADALSIQAAAAELSQDSTISDEVAELLAAIGTNTAEQMAALGGAYDPGPDYVARSLPAATPSAAPVTVETVIQLLADAANRTRGTMSTVADPLRARLYASIALSHYDTAVTLVQAAGVGVESDLRVSLPETDFSAAVTGVASAALPAGLAPDEAIAAIATLDAVGYAREQWGLHATGKKATRILDQSRVDRSRARAWAVEAGIADTVNDPREIFYVIGEGRPTVKALRQFVRSEYTAQAHRFLASVATDEVDDRQTLLDFATEAHLAARQLGAPLEALPALPEFTADTAE